MKLKHISRATILTLVLMLSGFCLRAQAPTYMQLLSIISAKAPGLDVSNKLIAFSSWSAGNASARATNKEMDRVGTIYQAARLKNGSKGVVVISVNTDEPSTSTIAFNKDGIKFAIKLNKAEYAALAAVPANYNCVYDITGAKVYENLAEDKVFVSFNQLNVR